MAAKNTFLIRAAVTTDGAGTFAQTEIDLGSYTNLGSSKPEILRIHRAHLYITDAAGEFPSMGGDTAGSLSYQLTTQSQAGLVQATDDSFVAGGVAGYRNPDGDAFPPTQNSGVMIMPQDYENGAPIAVPSLFLGGLSTANWSENVIVSLVLECTTEPMGKASAVALAISQQ